MLGVRQWCHGAFCVSRQHRLRRQWPRRIIHRLWMKVMFYTIGESRTQFPVEMTHKHNKWLQILAEKDFPPKPLWSENADFKFSVNNEEDVNKKPRSRMNIAYHSEGNADNKRQRNRRLKSEALWSFTVENPSLPIYVDQSLQSSALYYGPKNNNFQANCTGPYLFFVFGFF